MIQTQLKLRLRPAQERQFDRWLWHLTAVWNWAVRKLEADAREGTYHSPYGFERLLTSHGQRLGIPQDCLVGMARQAYAAWKRSRTGSSGRPRLKGRRNRLNSIPFYQGRQLRFRSETKVYVPILGTVRFHEQERPAGHVGMARVIKRASGWYLCLFIQAEREPIEPVADGEVGIDPGFSRLLTLSTGEIIEHPHELRGGAERLAQAHRGGHRRRAARLFERQANRRRDRNHKLSRRIVAENALIAWSKDATRVIARSFGKSVTSAAHHQLRLQIASKSRSGGRRFVEVDSRNSTRRCSVCRALSGPTGWRSLSVRRWQCAACGAEHDRDVNAARNTLIAALGMSVESGREVAPGIATEATRRDPSTRL